MISEICPRYVKEKEGEAERERCRGMGEKDTGIRAGPQHMGKYTPVVVVVCCFYKFQHLCDCSHACGQRAKRGRQGNQRLRSEFEIGSKAPCSLNTSHIMLLWTVVPPSEPETAEYIGMRHITTQKPVLPRVPECRDVSQSI